MGGPIDAPDTIAAGSTSNAYLDKCSAFYRGWKNIWKNMMQNWKNIWKNMMQNWKILGIFQLRLK